MGSDPYRSIASPGSTTVGLMSGKGCSSTTISNSQQLMGDIVPKASISKAGDINNNSPCDMEESSSDLNDRKQQQRISKKASKRLSKKILSCGSNFQTALSLLYQTHPQLEEAKSLNTNCSNQGATIDKLYTPESMTMDPRVISTTIDLLRRANQPKVAFDLFHRVLHIYRLFRESSPLQSENAETNVLTIDFFDLSMIFKSMISMLGHTQHNDSTTTESDPTRILQMLHDDIPTYTKQPPPLDMYHAAISALGRCKRMDLVEILLQEMESSRTNTVEQISCANTMGNTWTYIFPMPDRLAYLTAITASIRSKEPHYAIKILQRMKGIGMSPDVVSYNQVLASLSKSGGIRQNKMINRHVLALEILNEMEDSKTLSPNEATYDVVASICGKDGKWDIVSQLTDRQKKTNDKDQVAIDEASVPIDSKFDSTPVGSKRSLFQTSESITTTYMKDLEQIEKVGRGRMAWHKLGHYNCTGENVDDNSIAFGFGIQMHRNPRQNGLSVVFYEELTEKKLGYMLLRNTLINIGGFNSPQPTRDCKSKDFTPLAPQFYSSLLGMYIADDQRGRGLSNIFMAVWLRLCISTNTLPRTEKINKPLLSLVLSKFGFQPDDNDSGIDIEVSPISHVKTMPEHVRLSGWKPVFAVYSPSLKPLDGCFGERDLRIQKMVISRDPSVPRGKVTRVKTTFTHPITLLAIRELEEDKKSGLHVPLDVDGVKQKFEDKVEEILGGKYQFGKLELGISDTLLNRALFGFCVYNELHEN